MMNATQIINTFCKFNLITADPDDNKFIDCAVAAQAKYIVTEDRHYDARCGLDKAMKIV